MSKEEDDLIEEAFARKAMSKATFSRLLKYVLPYRRTFYLNLLFTVLATCSQLLGPKFIQVGIDRYLLHITTSEAAMNGILIISLIYLGNLLLGWYFSVVQVKSAIRVGQGAMNDLRAQVFAHIQKLSLNYFDQTHQGRIINRADSDIDSLDRILTWGGNQLLASGLTLIGVVILMLQYDWRLCLAVSLVLPFLGVATHQFHVKAMQGYRRVREQGSRITSAVAENIAGTRVIQAFARESENLKRFNVLSQEYAVRSVYVARIFHTFLPILGLLSAVGAVIILGYGGSLVMQKQITVGELAAFILYLSMFFGPIQTMGDLYNAVLSTAASAERIFELLDTQPQIQDQPTAHLLPEVAGRIDFQNVSFRYDTTPPDSWVLKNISFTAEAGQTIALVGATGSGKTSIISLIARFYQAQQGRILIDGHDITQTTTDSLRSQIGIVTQENFLFSGSVMENLKFGRPESTDEQVMEAARTLGTHELIQRFEKGYETPVTERGGNFSAGERQLLTFTRAMVAQPRILILDEATSSVDPQTEKIIQHALEKLFERRTSFVIAHRLSTVRHANLILVLKQGEIAEQGTHQQLLASSGIYAQLHREFTRSAG